jgi:hypothetical protein
MKFQLHDLVLTFKRSRESVRFLDFNYFFGQMGSGKSSLVRIVDYCLGGALEMTAALQSEFVSASLSVNVAGTELVLTRGADEGSVVAEWSDDAGPRYLRLPARSAGGVVVPGTQIEVLSDLIFYLAGIDPPRVRRSKIKEDSELGRLSLRDLLWFCYLDQDTIDSSFFHLDDDANPFKRLKSRDVLRFLIGFHQERVSELEASLEQKRLERLRLEASVSAMSELLRTTGFADSGQIAIERARMNAELVSLDHRIADMRADLDGLVAHGSDQLKARARELSILEEEAAAAITEIRETMVRDKAHRNELISLSTRARRSVSARAVLAGVEFHDCPRCGQVLPQRSADHCAVCDQPDSNAAVAGLDEASAERDVRARVDELSEVIVRYELELARAERRFREVCAERTSVDAELTRISRNYDSAYLSSALETEKGRAAVRQELLSLARLEDVTNHARLADERLAQLLAEEQSIRANLKTARIQAESDTKNVAILKELFLDCLLRSRVSGFVADDIVKMRSPHFLPEITSADEGDLAVTSFGNLGSGGKKTLFKCCFAVAVHRLSVRTKSLLPELLIIDSPMKNISERENREQFEGFHKMLHELSEGELKETQFILIDKESFVPHEGYGREFVLRHMKPDDDEHPPLITYYRGK